MTSKRGRLTHECDRFECRLGLELAAMWTATGKSYLPRYIAVFIASVSTLYVLKVRSGRLLSPIVQPFQLYHQVISSSLASTLPSEHGEYPIPNNTLSIRPQSAWLGSQETTLRGPNAHEEKRNIFPRGPRRTCISLVQSNHKLPRWYPGSGCVHTGKTQNTCTYRPHTYAQTQHRSNQSTQPAPQNTSHMYLKSSFPFPAIIVFYRDRLSDE